MLMNSRELNTITNANHPANQQPRRDSTMASKGVVATQSEFRFHPRTRIATPRDLETNVISDLPFQSQIRKWRTHRQQINLRQHQVSTQAGRLERFQTAPTRHDWKVLRLEHRQFTFSHLEPNPHDLRPPITDQSKTRLGLDFSDEMGRLLSFGAQHNRFNPSFGTKPLDQISKVFNGSHEVPEVTQGIG
jgi:hypothetical protein